MALDFHKDAIHVIVIGPNGIDKSTLARHIAYHALIHRRRLPGPDNCTVISPRSTAIPRCVGACATMPTLTSSPSTTSSPIPTAMPICYSNSSARRYERKARSSRPIGPSQNGTTPSRTPPASSAWSTVSVHNAETPAIAGEPYLDRRNRRPERRVVANMTT